jgi:hypothetical protein
MANQMVRVLSSMVLPEPGQLFMTGSMTWVIGANNVKEIMEAVQNHPAPIVPTATTTSSIPVPHRWVRRSIDNNHLLTSIDQVTNGLTECLSLTELILDRFAMSDKVPALQDHHATMTERIARPHRPGWQDSDMVIMATLEGRTVRCRPLPATSLRLANYEAPMENMLRPYPFGLVGA